MMKPPIGSRPQPMSGHYNTPEANNAYSTQYDHKGLEIGKDIPKGLSRQQFFTLLQTVSPGSTEYVFLQNNMAEILDPSEVGIPPAEFRKYMESRRPKMPPFMPGIIDAPSPLPGGYPMPRPPIGPLPGTGPEGSRPIHLLGGQPRPPGVSPGPPPGYSGPWM